MTRIVPGLVLVMDGADLLDNGAEVAAGYREDSWRGKPRPWVCVGTDDDDDGMAYWSPCTTNLPYSDEGFEIPLVMKSGPMRLWRRLQCGVVLTCIWRVPNEVAFDAWMSGPAAGKPCGVDPQWLERAVTDFAGR